MANQYTTDLTLQRKVAVKLLRRGEVTVAEIANHFGLGRQTVQAWARIAGIDVLAARKLRIARLCDRR